MVVEVADGEVGGASAGVEFDDLAFDPHDGHAVDVVLDVLAKKRDRPRVFGCGFECGGGQVGGGLSADCAGCAADPWGHDSSVRGVNVRVWAV